LFLYRDAAAVRYFVNADEQSRPEPGPVREAMDRLVTLLLVRGRIYRSRVFEMLDLPGAVFRVFIK